MYLLYSLLLTLGFVLLLPRFLIDAFRHGKYVTGLGQRLGNLPQIGSHDQLTIWLHCVSVGETRAAQSLVRGLRARFPDSQLVVSTSTVTGQQIANEIFAGEAAAIIYFPIDWAWTVRRALRAIQPSVVLIMETELWPRLFRECRRKQIPVALVNGRISDKSSSRYKLIRSFVRRVLNDLTLAVMQSAADAQRIRELGVSEDRLKISGNLKFDSAHVAVDQAIAAKLRERFNLRADQPLIVAASTHAPEEEILLRAFKTVGTTFPDARLLIAPRHPERFRDVAAMLAASDLSWVKRSGAPSGEDAKSQVLLLDSIGELGAVYSSAQIVFVGGSITPHGGHNVLEPAAQGICTITGPHTQNFAGIVNAMLEEGALIQLRESSDFAPELATVIARLLSDETTRREIGARASSVCQRHQGATEKTIEIISQLIRMPPNYGEALPLSTLRATTVK
ncbi:MAG TPA: 3-deoxy-D-manno-octulosonic acid transferase [Pyrinomonadaceae bacterium]|nr:3-deoxy-D-manno-octulosonic acid transferase [Pyrinomonadaceae bacterium]